MTIQKTTTVAQQAPPPMINRSKKDQYVSFSNQTEKPYVCMHSFWGLVKTPRLSKTTDGYSKVGSVQCHRVQCKYVNIKVRFDDGRCSNLCCFAHYETKELQGEEELKKSVAHKWELYRRGIITNQHLIHENMESKLKTNSKKLVVPPSPVTLVPIKMDTESNAWTEKSKLVETPKQVIPMESNPLVWSDVENEPEEFYKWKSATCRW